MKQLFEAMMQDKAIEKIGVCFAKEHGQNLVYGLAGSQKHAIMAASYDRYPRTTIIITSNQDAIGKWQADLAMLLPNVPILELPAIDVVTFSVVAKSIALAAKRMEVLGRLMRKEPVIVLASTAAAVQKGLSRQDFERSSVHLTIGESTGRDELLLKLIQLGYERVQQVESLGQFSARGGIVDIFPINSLHPIRMEFFDETIDSLREFAIETQRSLQNISSVAILPLEQLDNNGNPAIFLSYLEKQATVIFDEPTIAQDLAGRELIKSIIRKLKSEGKIVLTIIHDMDFVAEIFERTIVFAKGNVLLDSDTRDVFSKKEILEKAYLEQPSVTKLCRALGYEETFLTVNEFIEFRKNIHI